MKIPQIYKSDNNASSTTTISTEQMNFLKHEQKNKIKLIWNRILLLIIFIGVWQISSDLGWIDSFYFSSPTKICTLFIQNISGTSSMDIPLVFHIGITLWESTVSFFLIILFSLIIATLFWFMPHIASVFEPFLIVLNSLPKSALAPLIIVWLGTGTKTIILCGISVGIFGCILNLYQAFLQTDSERLKLIQTLGGNKWQVFTKVVFPGNIPTFLSIAKVNIGLALVGVIIGEFLAGRRGLGYLIIYGSQVYQLNLVIMSIVILCLIAVLIYSLLNYIEKKYLNN